jgi:hypothetical protein
MRQLSFPDDEIVGILDWPGLHATHGGPVLATGVVEVPEETEISLNVHRIKAMTRDNFSRGGFIRTTPSGVVASHDFGWHSTGSDDEPLDLGFLLRLSPESIADLRIVGGAVLAGSLTALPHLAPGLKRLYLGFNEFEDAVLKPVAQLQNLLWLQTWDNRFTDAGVQQLASLKQLESLYLEEESLTPAAFDFVSGLPRLRRLGVADEWPPEYVLALRGRYPTLLR